MIERYTSPRFKRIWSEETKYNAWRDVEIASAKAQGCSEDILNEIESCATPPGEDIAAAEMVTQHDVAAFLQAWRGRMSTTAAGWVHRNMTSSDLVDSANALRLRWANEEIDSALAALAQALAQHAVAHRGSQRAARTHGQHAEASSWGYRVADILMGLQRARTRFVRAREVAEVCKLSGPVGDYKHVSRETEVVFAKILGLGVGLTSTQVVMRDGYADLLWSLAQIATVIEALALEVRLGQRTEVGELAEGFTAGQVGSSAMPHKRNPITSEKLCGLAKLVRAQVMPTLEGVALHHERDISHSSVERVTLVTSTTLTFHMVESATSLIRNLLVDIHQMSENTRFSEYKLRSAHFRNQLVEQGVDPDVAWSVVAEACTRADEHAEGKFNLVETINDLLEDRNYLRRRLAPVPAPRLDHVFKYVRAVAQNPNH